MKYLKSNRGSALLFALLLTGMLTLIGLMAIDNSNTDIDLSYNQSAVDAAFYNAEAGAKRAFVTVNDSNDWRAGYNSVDFGNGTFSVVMVDASTIPALDDTVIIRAQGDVNDATGRVEVWTVPEYVYPFKWAMFGKSGINLDRGTCTDSYNSDSGSYAATMLQEEGDLGTNGSVTGSRDITIGGDVQTATGGSISFGTNSTITGDTSTTMDSVYIPDIPQSEFDYAEANSNAALGMSGSGWAYNVGTKNLSTGAYGQVVLTSGVYYFNSISLEQGSEIRLAPGADVTIYVLGDITLAQGSKVNDGGIPSALKVFSNGDLNFHQDNTFYGSYYGPNAHIQYDQTTQVYGSLVGNTIQLDRDACFHYDRDLAKVKYGTTGRMLQVAWQEL